MTAEARVPPELRGRDGFTRLVAGIALRASVTGVGARFTLTRLAHQALRARRLRVYAKARPDDMPAGDALDAVRSALARRRFEAALARDARRAWPLQALVLDPGHCPPAQARDFNVRVCQARYVLVPGVARDPVDGSLRPNPEQAAAIGASAPPGSLVVSGEADRAAARGLREAALAAGAHFADAAPRGPSPLPGAELATVVDRFLVLAIGAGLSAGERVHHLAGLQRRLRWMPSALADVRWLRATGLRNPCTLRAALDHVLQTHWLRAHAVAHVGAAPAEVEALLPVLKQALLDGALAHAYLAGPGAGRLAQGLRSLPVSLLHPQAGARGVLDTLARECRGGAVVTLGEPGGAWGRSLDDGLRLPGVPDGVWSPNLDDVVTDLAIPRITAARVRAPAVGRRPRVHILGDPDPPLDPVPRKVAFVAPVASA